jgi:Glycosyl hydrolase family 31 C-terminal domain
VTSALRGLELAAADPLGPSRDTAVAVADFIADRPLQYQLGDDLLVAPVTEPGASTWRVFLPACEWTDFFTGDVHSRPIIDDRPVPFTEIPVYRRSV